MRAGARYLAEESPTGEYLVGFWAAWRLIGRVCLAGGGWRSRCDSIGMAEVRLWLGQR